MGHISNYGSNLRERGAGCCVLESAHRLCLFLLAVDTLFTEDAMFSSNLEIVYVYCTHGRSSIHGIYLSRTLAVINSMRVHWRFESGTLIQFTSLTK